MTRTRQTVWTAVVGWLALSAAAVAAQNTPPPQAPQSRPLFQSEAILVPVDVRVLDRHGTPIAGLQASDFTVLEDGVPQTIRHFVVESFVADPAAATAQPLMRTSQAPDAAAPRVRVFLIVLGRGLLQEPAKGLDAAIRFVRERLLPQDQIAVMAWNRATDFSTDHEATAAFIERYRKESPHIESELVSLQSGLAAVYGSKSIPASVQREIDAVFGGRTRSLNEAPGTLGLTGTSFEDYVSASVQTMQDMTKLYRGIEYLRHLQGEKHLIFISQYGLFLPRAEDDRGLAAAASDARVTLDVIHTGGIAPGGGPGWSMMTSETIAEQTGGYFGGNIMADKAMATVDATTRGGYELGYYPTNSRWNGAYRRIVVRVNRPGATVIFRHGYYGSEALSPLETRHAVTYTRLAAAGSFAQDIHDLKLVVTATQTRGTGGHGGEVDVAVTIDASRIAFASDGDRHVAHLDIAVFCGDSRESLVGQEWQAMDLKLLDDTFARFRREGIPYKVTVPVRLPASYAKVVVYDYGADLVGSALIKLR